MYPLQRNENCTGLAQIARLGDAGELTRTEAAIKVEASLRQGTCGANPDTPERVGRSILMQASNPFECVAASGLWTPTGTVTMETLQAEGFFVDMDAIASFADACSQANVRTARTVFRRLYEAFGRPTYQWICCTVHSLFGLHFRPLFVYYCNSDPLTLPLRRQCECATCA